ncbi:hypothetical protein MBLNU13_g00389t1 [Cladosporium sp. NU13]
MLIHLLLLSFVSFVCPHIINPRQNFNASTPTPTAGTSAWLESASQCIKSKRSWAAVNGTKFASTTVYITSNTYEEIYNLVDYKTTTSLEKNATAYTLCDKWPRLDGSTSISSHSYQSIVPWTSSFIKTESVSTAFPAPNCTILKPECDILYTSFSSAESSWNASWSSYDSYRSSALSAGVVPTRSFPQQDYTSPICGSPTPFLSASAVGPPGCAVDKATVQLLYWPVARQTSDLCNGNASLATMTPTISGKPNTAVYEGTTLTSPTVYIALDGTWRVTSSGSTIDQHSLLILPQKPTDVSSVCAISGGGYNTYAVDYADFGGAVPASAYRCQPRCNTNTFKQIFTNTSIVYTGFTFEDTTVPESTRTFMRNDWDGTRDGYPSENLCSTIWDDYRPALSIPAEFSSMKPAQGMGRFNCEFIFSNDSIFYDPPKALMGESAIIKPTLPGKPPADPEATAKPTADPGSVPKPTTPTPTQLPSVETDPPAVPDGPSQSPDPVTSTPYAPSQPSQSPDPGTDRPDVPEESSQRPDSDTSNVPDRPSDSPNPSTDEPDAPAEPSSPGSGNSDKPEASPNRPPGSTNTRSGSHNEDDPAQATAGSGPTQTGSSHNTQVKPAPTGVVITASNGDHVTAIQTQAAGPVVVGGVTLTQGQSTDIDGVGEVVVGSSGLSVGSTFHTFTAVGPAATPAVVLTDSTGNEVTVSHGSDAGDVVVGSSTLALGALIIAGLGDFAASTDGPHSAPTSNAFVLAGTTFAAHGTSAISLSPDVTLVPGGPAVSIDGQVLSLAPSGTIIVVDGTTQRPTSPETPAPTLKIGGTAYTANQASDFVVDGATLTRGGSVVVDGTTVSLDPSGGYAVVNGVTQSLSAPVTTASPAPTLDISGTTYTANQTSNFVIGGTTLTRGGSVVIDGTTVSLDASGGDVVVNGVTQTISAPATTTASSTDENAGESATPSTTGGNTDESATPSASASASDGGSTPASSACSIATNSPWVSALVTILGVCFLL